jgi:hypothetical protein
MIRLYEDYLYCWYQDVGNYPKPPLINWWLDIGLSNYLHRKGHRRKILQFNLGEEWRFSMKRVRMVYNSIFWGGSAAVYVHLDRWSLTTLNSSHLVYILSWCYSSKQCIRLECRINAIIIIPMDIVRNIESLLYPRRNHYIG